MTGQNPHFFCENCGAEVPLRAGNCPQCGRTFSSVRCPACNFVGEEALFADGCPVCGFTTDPQSTDRRAADRRPADLKPDKPGAPVKTGKGRETGSGGSSPGALPLWVYIVSALALAGMGYLVLTWLF